MGNEAVQIGVELLAALDFFGAGLGEGIAAAVFAGMGNGIAFAIGVGPQFFEEEHEEAVAVMAGDGGADFLTFVKRIAVVVGALHGAAADFDFGGVGGTFEGGIPLLGEGLGFEEGGSGAVLGIAGLVGGLTADASNLDGA